MPFFAFVRAWAWGWAWGWGWGWASDSCAVFLGCLGSGAFFWEWGEGGEGVFGGIEGGIEGVTNW